MDVRFSTRKIFTNVASVRGAGSSMATYMYMIYELEACEILVGTSIECVSAGSFVSLRIGGGKGRKGVG